MPDTTTRDLPRHRAPGSASRHRTGRRRAGRTGVAAQVSGRWSRVPVLIGLAALPAYALLLLWSTLSVPPDPVAAPTAWAAHVLSAHHGPAALLAGSGGGPLLTLGALGAAALLAGSAGRGAALAAVVCAVAGTAVSQPLVGVTAHAALAAAEAVQAGATAAAGWYAQAQEAAAGPATVGVVLFGLAWLLLGVAVWRAPGLTRADGVLFAVAAPLLVAAAALPTLTPVAALPLLAGGFGVVWAAAGQNRKTCPSGSATPTTHGSPTTGP